MDVIDLFSGAGGLTEGFKIEGYNIIAHIEKDPWACETLKTRICFHYLRENNMLGDYNSYLETKKTYSNTDTLRNHYIIKKHPEIEEQLRSVFNITLGNPKEEKNVIASVDAISLINDCLRKQGSTSISVIIGGPPCQAYSVIGRGRMGEKASADKRNFLFRYYYDLVEEFRPKLFLFENVPGLLTAKQGEIWLSIQEDFDHIGYEVLSGSEKDAKKNIICASDFGVPQNRKRLILIGYDKHVYPNGVAYPDFFRYAPRIDEPLTTLNAIGDLPHLKAGNGKDFWFGYYSSENVPFSEYQKKMRIDSIGFTNHAARPHREEDLKIYKLYLDSVAEGKKLKYSDLPSNLQFHKNRDRDVFQDRFRSHELNLIPHTIVAHLSKDGHYNIHPDPNQLRSLTVREAARIQSFPDNYLFEGPRTSQFTQVGNAVPPLISQSYAKAIKEQILYR